MADLKPAYLIHGDDHGAVAQRRAGLKELAGKQGEVEQHLTSAMGQMPPETTVALFAREENRSKAPTAVHDAVKRAGGQIVAQATVKPWELGKWARAQGARLGIELDAPAAN